jgi:hypothetical protein
LQIEEENCRTIQALNVFIIKVVKKPFLTKDLNVVKINFKRGRNANV